MEVPVTTQEGRTVPVDDKPVDKERPSSRIDTSVAHPARRYNYWLGGKDHFAVDRASGDAVAQNFPSVRTAALENRAFLRRAVTFLVQEAGVRQFLDIGCGIPAPDHAHEVAQRLVPECRVVYVDNDPIVMSHSRALLTSSADGVTAYVEADLKDGEAILADPDVRRTLDFSQPIALLLVAVLHFLEDRDDPYPAVRQLTQGLPAGSYVALSHVTWDLLPPQTVERTASIPMPHGPFRPRTRDEILRFLDGTELVSPGLVPINEWRAQDEPLPRPTSEETATYGAVARIL
jgi:SAM-dependent methyltransferase